MAQFNPSFTAPVATKRTELYYSQQETGTATQIFGVQGIPALTQTTEDITYRTLESEEEFGAPGIKAFAAIEITVLLYKEQHETLKALDGKELWWYVKYPDVYGITYKWKGQMSYTLDSLELDDMCKATLKIYKSSTPVEVENVPQPANVESRSMSEVAAASVRENAMNANKVEETTV